MFRSLTIGLAALVLGGCGDGAPDPAPFIAASVAGTAWRRPASDGIVVYDASAPDGLGTVYSISSREGIGGTQSLALNLPNPPAVGTYPLGGDTASATYASCPTGAFTDCSYWKAIAADPGTLEITAIDTATGSIEGTFAFDGHFLGDSAGPVKAVTNGRFRIRFRPGP